MYCLDYGTSEIVPVENIYPGLDTWNGIHEQTVPCKLAGVKPVSPHHGSNTCTAYWAYLFYSFFKLFNFLLVTNVLSKLSCWYFAANLCEVTLSHYRSISLVT